VAKSTHDDYELLKTRFRNHLDREEVESFNKSMHLFYEREKTANHNLRCLYDLNKPVCRIDAVHTGVGAKSAKPDIAGQLTPVLLLAEGSKVMLLWNIWSEGGLHNGLLGTVVEIVYKNGSGPPQLPLFVLISVSKRQYFGPPLSDDSEECLIPIAPVKASFIHRGYCTRMQIPLGLADAVTIHKSQGCNVDSCVVDIFKEEPNSAPGLAFTALSRCHHLEDMVLAPFDFDRLAMLSRMKPFVARIAELKRLNDLFLETKERYRNVAMPEPGLPPQTPVNASASSSVSGHPGQQVRAETNGTHSKYPIRYTTTINFFFVRYIISDLYVHGLIFKAHYQRRPEKTKMWTRGH